MIRKYLLSLLLTVIVSQLALAQQSEHPGVALYKAGKYAEAANALHISLTADKTHKSDAGIWNYLGLSHLAIDNFKAARKAFEEATDLAPQKSEYFVNLGYAWMMLGNTDKAQSATKRAIAADPQNASAYYLRGSASLWENKLDDAKDDADRILAVDPSFVQGYILQSDILIARLGRKLAASSEGDAVRENLDLLKEARDILRAGLQATAKAPNRKVIEDESNALEAFYEYFSKERPVPGTAPDPSIKPIKITSKRKAIYTDRARQANIQGAIRVAVLFGASGRVEHVLLLRKLGYGLDQEAIAAARQIKFEPAEKDGKPISTVRLLEYVFSIY